MKPAPHKAAKTTRPSLVLRLLLWGLGALVLVWASLVWVGYRTGIHEADELTDGHLASTAALLLNLRRAEFVVLDEATARITVEGLKSHDYQQSMSASLWDADGRLITHSGLAPVPAFNPHGEGFGELLLGTPPMRWRSFTQWDAAHTRMVTVLLDLEERNDLAEDISEQLVQPGLLLLPLVALALGLTIWRALQPLRALSDDVAQLEAAPSGRLQARHPYREVDAVVHAINILLDGQQAALMRERQLASEVAHELRTPLASIALQSEALQSTLAPDEQARALQRLQRDALQAGHVLTQLLSLARASRMEMAEAAQPLELMALARRVVADYAQAAWQSGHVLSVSGSDGLVVQGHTVLVELALRNLVENALRHTARGTEVEVRTGQDEALCWLEVCDTGLTQGAHKPADALGLGHKIVQRVAEVHGGTFAQMAPESGVVRGKTRWQSCYRLCLVASQTAGKR